MPCQPFTRLTMNPQPSGFWPLDSGLVLLLIRRHRSNNTGGHQDPRNDSARIDCRLERALAYFAPQRSEERVAGLRDATADNDHIGIEDVEQVRYAGAEEARRLADHIERDIIALLRCLVDRRRCNLARVASGHFQHQAVVAAQCLTSAIGNRWARCIRFKASVVAALAATARDVNGGVSDFTGDVRRAMTPGAIRMIPGATAPARRVRHAARSGPRRICYISATSRSS